MSQANEKKRVRFAVVGAGNIAQVAVMPAFSHVENAELTTLVSSDAKKREELGDRYDLAKTYGYDQFDELCQSGDIDAVYIALPNSMHREYTERAARAKIHVLCEKPMARTVRRLRSDDPRVRRERREADDRVSAPFRGGEPQSHRARRNAAPSANHGSSAPEFTQQARPGDIRTQGALAGGALYDAGVYCVNAARYIFRDEPIEVAAFRHPRHRRSLS